MECLSCVRERCRISREVPEFPARSRAVNKFLALVKRSVCKLLFQLGKFACNPGNTGKSVHVRHFGCSNAVDTAFPASPIEAPPPACQFQAMTKNRAAVA
jgi:hypothetical protein